MKRQFAKLQRIDQNEPITYGCYDEFIDHLQGSVLLALQDRGRLLPMEYRYAEDKIKQQRLRRARKLLEDGERE